MDISAEAQDPSELVSNNSFTKSPKKDSSTSPPNSADGINVSPKVNRSSSQGSQSMSMHSPTKHKK